MDFAFRRSTPSLRSVPHSRSGWDFVFPLLAIAAMGCARDPAYPGARGERHLVVHGMLAAGVAQQEIIVEYTRGVEDGYFRGLTPASGVRVTVTGEEATAFQEDALRPGVYLGSFTPRSGKRYMLRVQGSAGETATAETLIPGIPRIVAPTRDTAVSRDTRVPVRWSSPPAVGFVVLHSPPNQPSPVGSLRHAPITRDTSTVMQFGVLGGTSFKLQVAAVDRNFVHYIGADTLMPVVDRSRVRSTLVGAYGLFGSFGLGDPRLVVLQ